MQRCMISKIALIILMVITGLYTISPVTSYAAKEYTVSGQTSQKLYEGASENSKVVANIIPGNSFTILETVKDSNGKNWHHVALSGGVTGYVIASRVIEIEADAAEEAVVENTEAAENTEDNPQEQETEATEENTGDQEEAENTADRSQEQEREENEEAQEKAASEELTNVTVTTLSNINLRDEPSLEGDVLIVIPRGITIAPLEKIDRDNYIWYRLSYLNQTGYIRADAVEEHVEESEETAEETTDASSEESSVSSPVISTSKVVRSNNSVAVSYNDSYDRRHKWDDPEVIALDDSGVPKRFIDVYMIVFVLISMLLSVIAFFMLGNASSDFRRHFRRIRKRRKHLGEDKWKK